VPLPLQLRPAGPAWLVGLAVLFVMLAALLTGLSRAGSEYKGLTHDLVRSGFEVTVEQPLGRPPVQLEVTGADEAAADVRAWHRRLRGDRWHDAELRRTGRRAVATIEALARAVDLPEATRRELSTLLAGQRGPRSVGALRELARRVRDRLAGLPAHLMLVMALPVPVASLDEKRLAYEVLTALRLHDRLIACHGLAAQALGSAAWLGEHFGPGGGGGSAAGEAAAAGLAAYLGLSGPERAKDGVGGLLTSVNVNAVQEVARALVLAPAWLALASRPGARSHVEVHTWITDVETDAMHASDALWVELDAGGGRWSLLMMCDGLVRKAGRSPHFRIIHRIDPALAIAAGASGSGGGRPITLTVSRELLHNADSEAAPYGVRVSELALVVRPPADSAEERAAAGAATAASPDPCAPRPRARPERAPSRRVPAR
jgi:hypothetical protein